MWVCPACGGGFSIKQSPFPLGMKTGTGADDVMFLRAACPDHKDGAIIDLFKLYTNKGGSGLVQEATSFTNDGL
eukprot:12428788-Karenia_brevis.AAC.1